jgi:hypothetical protein
MTAKTIDERIREIENKGTSISGTTISRYMDEKGNLGWCLAVGDMAQPKKFYYGKTIDDVVTIAEKELK